MLEVALTIVGINFLAVSGQKRLLPMLMDHVVLSLVVCALMISSAEASSFSALATSFFKAAAK